MKNRFLPFLCVLLPLALAGGTVDAKGPAKSGVGLAPANVSKLARGTGTWVHVAAFNDGRAGRHLLCRRTKKATRAGCLIATRDGRVIQKRVTIAPTKDGRALAFRVGSRVRDKWVRVGLRPGVAWTANGSDSPQVQNGSLESAFGVDLSDVRIHAGGGARTSELGAAAMTNGSHVALGRSSDLAPKQNLLAHELTHVVAQGSGGDNPTGNTEENSGGNESGGNESDGGDSGGDNSSDNTGSNNSGD